MSMDPSLFSDVPIDKVDPSLFSEEPAPKYSELESFGRGTANNIPLVPQAIAAVAPGGYSQNLSDWNRKAAEAKTANPISYGAGAVTGTVAPMLIPGVGAAMEAAPVLSNAALGAASAISNTDLLKNPDEAIHNAAVGGTIGGVIGKLGSMIPSPEGLAAKATSNEAVAARLANPAMEAGDVEAMSRALPKTFGKMRQVASGVNDYADQLLSSSPYIQPSAGDAGGAIPKDQLQKVIQNVRSGFTGMSDEGSSALKTLDQWAERADKLHETISQQNLKGFIRNIDRDINWDRIRFNPTYQPTLEEQGLMHLRGTLDDMLKGANPEYAKQMEIVSDALTNAREFSKKFGLVKEGPDIFPGDRTAGVLDKALVGSKADTQRILENTANITGDDLKTPLLLRQFQGPTPENPAGTISKIGAGMAGAAFGHGMGLGGMGLGAVVGHRALHEPISVAGRRGAEWVLQNVSQNPALRSYLPTLMAAAQRGGNSLISNHYILMQQDPQYNKAFTQGMDGTQGQ